MLCLPQAGFVIKYDQKLTTLGGILGCWQPQARSCLGCQECRTGLFGALVGDSEGGVWTERNGAFWVKQECHGGTLGVHRVVP